MKKYISDSTKHTNTLTKILILAFLILAGGYLIQKFFQYWNFQSPVTIKVRSPLKRVYLYENKMRIEPLTPTSKPHQSPKNAPILSPTPKVKSKASISSFPKYLTDNGAKNREQVLAWASQKYSGDELVALDNIFKKEAGYRPDAINEIGACGIGQALPCEKMGCPLDQSGLECQFNWVVKYIENRYQGSPIIAWNFHLKNNWY